MLSAPPSTLEQAYCLPSESARAAEEQRGEPACPEQNRPTGIRECLLSIRHRAQISFGRTRLLDQTPILIYSKPGSSPRRLGAGIFKALGSTDPIWFFEERGSGTSALRSSSR